MSADFVFTGENDVPEKAIQIIDASVLAKLPPGTIGESIIPSGASYWTRTARIRTTLPDGSTKAYSLKTSSGQKGKDMCSGEFLSIITIHNALPDFVPQPIEWGTYLSDPNIHFFLCSFHDMTTDELPAMEPFCANIAALHKNSTSPTGKFGFPVSTFYGNLPQNNSWTDTWEEFFLQCITRSFETEEESKGSISLELRELKKPLYEKVIPRLLRPLERSITPALIHGDLWSGNLVTDKATNKPLIYDAGCVYAHNEFELGSWRDPLAQIPKEWMREYHTHYPISAPAEDWEDRNALYGMVHDLRDSALFQGTDKYRKLAIDTIRRLVEKYPGGFEEWAGAQ